MNRVRRLRWRLAHLIAPDPIIRDPHPGREAFVVHRSKPGVAPSTQLSVALDELDIKIENKPPRLVELELAQNPNAKVFYNTTRRVVTVTGRGES